MRTDRSFIDQYQKAVLAVDPAAKDLSRDRVRALALTELCLCFLTKHLPEEDISAVPYLMLGYPRLLEGKIHGTEFARGLSALRHLCIPYVSVSAWLDACRNHNDHSEIIRCHEIVQRKPRRRTAAPESIERVLIEQLNRGVPWVERTLQIADPGEAFVQIDRGEILLSYQIPALRLDLQSVHHHRLVPRPTNPSIKLDINQIMQIALRIDEREARDDWPESLPKLKLHERLEKLHIEGLSGGFFENGTITLDGAVHVVGMLSSGKSTLVMALLFALTLGENKKRITVLVSDTIQGATLAARLRHHGISATVLSSLHNRERHLESIHWQQGLASGGCSFSSIGDIAQSFSVACPLDGMQGELQPIRGNRERVRFPHFHEKQCRRIFQRLPPESIKVESDAGEPEDLPDDSSARVCPLWARCPAQEQQRSAVDAQVLVMTPQAFVHMTPDPWTSEHHVTMPELVQYISDLIIIDEVDGVQRVMDEIFAPRAPIMGDERDVYAPTIGTRSSEALRERSGIQFRREINAKWQSNFYTFFRLIGLLYALLQNEQVFLMKFFDDAPFTAASILYDLWRRRSLVLGRARHELSLENTEIEEQFVEVIKVASVISHLSRTSSISQEEAANSDGIATPNFRDNSFRDACDALRDIATRVLISDYYHDLADDVEQMLDGPLSAFCASSAKGSACEDALRPRENALAILLAVVTDLALAHYNWLIRTQPAVARDFGIDDAHLLSQANNLIRHYRTLLPSNPAGAVFGLLYDKPPAEKENQLGGKLTLVNHLGVGRHLITHLHDLLAAEGQAGPHVLMLSGTSWAGGSTRHRDPKTRKPIDAASPSFDVQVPVRGILRQPEAELSAIDRSEFSLVRMPTAEGKQIRVSGVQQKERAGNLKFIAQRLATKRDGVNLFDDHWAKMSRVWQKDDLADRRRSLLVVQSYADAAVVADALVDSFEGYGGSEWKVFCLVRDQADDDKLTHERPSSRTRKLPRSLVERFGQESEYSVLVAPMPVVARGHNILNRHSKAAISSIYFLHRPHPRPDDLGPLIGRLNRYAAERFEQGLQPSRLEDSQRLAVQARRMRHAATHIVRQSLDARGGYSALSTEHKAQFAWDLITPLWQTIGRGIRNGCPVFVGFVDRQFAPLSFDDQTDTTASSVLVQAIRQLELAMDSERNHSEHRIAQLLYEPFYKKLRTTKGLIHVSPR